MTDSVEQLILNEMQAIRSELQDFRADVQSWQQDAGERVATLETKVLDLCGNGQPGRMKRAEDSISTLQRFRYGMMGAAAGISGLVSTVWWAVARFIQ
jgi:hypothetical protein